MYTRNSVEELEKLPKLQPLNHELGMDLYQYQQELVKCKKLRDMPYKHKQLKYDEVVDR